MAGQELPAWTGALLAGTLRAAARDVPCSDGTHVEVVRVDVMTPVGDVRAWAEEITG
ncbi:hypothetical protein [Streptomyces sp. NPDC088785]|uniref:hypothetical protein n=1 Tax=Streptomyces sp. NPDC088785 TaxID=3365897 RepID=UPI00381E4A69